MRLWSTGRCPSLVILAILPVLLLAACGGEEETPEGERQAQVRRAPRRAVSPVVIPPGYPQRLQSFVILLEEDDGSVGEVDVEAEGRKVTLSEAKEAVNFEDPSQTIKVTNRELQEVAGKLLAGEVAPPREYVLYFPLDGTRPTAASRRELSRILAEVTRRRVPEITVSGHADRIGTEAVNEDLSSKRARWVADRLIEAGVAAEDVEIRSYGETRPAIITPDGAQEPLNRRVVIRAR